MMILESSLLSEEQSGAVGLSAALSAMIAADRQMVWASDRPRLRMRLLYERMRLCRQLANAGDPRQKIFERWGELDGRRLQRLAKFSEAKLWIFRAAKLAR